MNTSNPLDPRPSDWEAALKVIEAAELRHDRAVLRRRWAGWGALVLVLFWGGFAWLSRVDSGASVVPAHSTQLGGNSGIETEGAPEQSTAFSVSVEPTTEQQAQVDGSDIEGAPAVAPRSSGFVMQATDELLPASLDEPPFVALLEQEEVEQLDARPLRLLGQRGGADLVPSLREVSERPVERRWNPFLGREVDAWLAGVSVAWSSDWRVPVLRVGAVRDQRDRHWFARPEQGVFGQYTARSISSNEAFWALIGADWTRHITGRWSSVASVECQLLLARHMTPAAQLLGEPLVPTSAPVWGTLEEERRMRVCLALGADWAATEHHALRLAVSGYFGADRPFDYLVQTSGAPRTFGELRATWIWK